MTLTLCSLLLAQRDNTTATEQRNWMLVCWAGMALSVLSKGLIGIILPGGALMFYMIFARDWHIWFRLHVGKGLLFFLLIAAPWFVLVGIRNPEQPYFFFIHEHFDRFLLKEHHREAPWWTFLMLLAAGSIPWLGVLLQSMVAGVKRGTGAFQPSLLLLIWILFIVAFFTKSNSKLPGYILPVFPAVALLIGVYLVNASRRVLILNACLMLTLGLILLGLLPFVTRFSKRASEVTLYQAYIPWILGAGIVTLAGGGLAIRQAYRKKHDVTVIVVALAGFIATQLLLAGFESIGQVRSGVNLLPILRAEMQPATRLYSVGMYEQSLTFYLQRPVVLVEYRDEFDFGLKQQPDLAIPKISDFVSEWRRKAAVGSPALAIVRNDIAAALRRQGVPFRLVATDERRTVLANY